MPSNIMAYSWDDSICMNSCGYFMRSRDLVPVTKRNNPKCVIACALEQMIDLLEDLEQKLDTIKDPTYKITLIDEDTEVID